MESTKAPLNIGYTILTQVKRLEERIRIVSAQKKEDGTIQLVEESQGWFIQFEGSWEALYFGDTKPHFEIGDTIKITFHKELHAQPSKPPVE